LGMERLLERVKTREAPRNQQKQLTRCEGDNPMLRAEGVKPSATLANFQRYLVSATRAIGRPPFHDGALRGPEIALGHMQLGKQRQIGMGFQRVDHNAHLMTAPGAIPGEAAPPDFGGASMTDGAERRGRLNGRIGGCRFGAH
jgi:hypothetical protein